MKIREPDFLKVLYIVFMLYNVNLKKRSIESNALEKNTYNVSTG